MAEFPHGTPSWVELNAPDAAAAAQFYTALFGWSAEASGDAEQTGGYQMFLQDGASVAGLMQVVSERQPTAWMTYIAVDDADAIADKVNAAGGQTLIAPMDVMDIGRMAVFADPGGALFGVWQARAFGGADVVNKPVSLCWSEVLTRDKATTLEFYPAIFGWRPAEPDFEPNNGYTVWQLPDGTGIGGAMEMTDEWFAPSTPPQWSVCFAVADTDATVDRAKQLGATVTMDPMDCPIGRFAGFVDPQGAAFTVMQLTPR